VQTEQVEYPGWAQFIIFIFITATMVPIIVTLLLDLIRNPRGWLNGIKHKFNNIIELHPDPIRMDPSRRKTPEETEMNILKEDVNSEAH